MMSSTRILVCLATAALASTGCRNNGNELEQPATYEEQRSPGSGESMEPMEPMGPTGALDTEEGPTVQGPVVVDISGTLISACPEIESEAALPGQEQSPITGNPLTRLAECMKTGALQGETIEILEITPQDGEPMGLAEAMADIFEEAGVEGDRVRTRAVPQQLATGAEPDTRILIRMADEGL